MKPDYNNGEWHGWNGGDRPVHPKSKVDYVWHNEADEIVGISFNQPAIPIDHNPWSMIVKFRVVTSYIEPPFPAELWTCGSNLFASEADAIKYRDAAFARPISDGRGTFPIRHWVEVVK